MIHSRYIEEENILHLDRKGEIRIQDLFAQVQETVSNYKRLQCLYILDDARDSTPQFSTRDYPKLSKRIGEALVHFKEVRHAILTASAMNTAMGILFENMANEIPSYSFKTFISEEAARTWLSEGRFKCE